VAGAPQGTPPVVACPTRSAAWSAGDDQAAPGPDYDCAQHFPGTVSPDGTLVTFHVTAESESTPGQLSLAIVPDFSSTAGPTGASPFGVDFNPPDQSSFSTEGGASESSSFNLPSYAGPVSSSVGGPLGLPAANPPPVAPVRPAAPTSTAPRAGGIAPAKVAATSPLLVLRTRFAAAAGALCLVAAVLLWSAGFGLLGGRVIPLSTPLRRA